MTEHDFLEISPYQEDRGKRIGRLPSEVPSELLSLKFKTKNPSWAIRDKCIHCRRGNTSEVRKCDDIDCPLWPHRMGMNPFHDTTEEISGRAERLRTEVAK